MRAVYRMGPMTGDGHRTARVGLPTAGVYGAASLEDARSDRKTAEAIHTALSQKTQNLRRLGKAP